MEGASPLSRERGQRNGERELAQHVLEFLLHPLS